MPLIKIIPLKSSKIRKNACILQPKYCPKIMSKSFIENIADSSKRSIASLLNKPPKTKGKIKLKGIGTDVEILRDEYGIPHIYAKNLPDLLFAQGYTHAQERLWQMELARRAASGTLSELLGERTLDADIAARTLGFRRLALGDLKSLDVPLLELVQVYVNGINAFIRSNEEHLGVEFKLLRHRPALWSVGDVMCFSRMLSWQMSHAWQGTLIRAQIIDRVGKEKAADWEINYHRENPSILKNGEWGKVRNSATMMGLEHPLLQQNGGSNSWAITAERSTSGASLLCNDPHLFLSAPAIWYENHLHCPDLHVTGVTIPGTPLVLIGHNEHIGWGITLAFTDCEDIFVEEFKDFRANEYLRGEDWHEATVLNEVVFVKGQAEPHIEKVVVTHHGPIVSDVVGYPQHRIALCSAALQPEQRALQSWWLLNHAANFDEFRTALSYMDAPQLNITYADRAGNIGYALCGKIPMRREGNGKLPVPGWSGEFDWTGYIPSDEMPFCLNPERGFVVTANNRVAPDDYPHYLGEVWMNGFRARRIEEVLQSKEKISFDDCRRLQTDVYCIPGKAFATHYIPLYEQLSGSRTSTYEKALFHLATWDGYLDSDSIGGCIYHITYQHAVRLLLQIPLGDGLIWSLLGNGFHPISNPTNEFQGHLIVSLLRLLDLPDNWWIQEAGGKNFLLERALRSAVDWLSEQVGNTPNNWKWGHFHKLKIPHAFSAQKPLDKVFSVGSFPVGGDLDTPFQTGNIEGKLPSKRLISASFRQILDLGNWDNSKAVLPPGESGHITSIHYKDQMQLWLAGKLRPMAWSRKQVEVLCEQKLYLVASS